MRAPLLWIESGTPSLPRADDLKDRVTAAWLIDTHRGLSWRADVARSFDVVFVAQRAAVRALADDHLVRATWLPLAFPGDVAAASKAPTVDVDFVGNVAPGSKRASILGPLADRYDIPLGSYVPPARMIDRYSKARVVINVPLARDLNMRTFEAIGAGAHLITGPMDGLHELLPPGLYTVVESDNPTAWLAAAEAALASDAGLGDRRLRARKFVLEHHTYDERARVVIEMLYGASPDDRPAAEDLGRAAAALGLPRIAASGGGSPIGRAGRVGVAVAIATRRRIGEAVRPLRGRIQR